MNKVIKVDDVLYIQQYQNTYDIALPCQYCDCCNRDKEHTYLCLAGDERETCFKTGSFFKKIPKGV